MFVTIITDCADSPTFGRQLTHLATLFNCPLIPISLDTNLSQKAQLEAAGNLIDTLDCSQGQEGIILVNAAPRSHKKWPNGTPFGYFYINKTLVLASVDGYTLSLVKKLNLVQEINLLDIPTVIEFMTKNHSLPIDLGEKIIHTQFRSLEFLPRVAKWLTDGYKLPFTIYNIQEVEDVKPQIWLVDCFGNCKTTLLPEEVDFEHHKMVSIPDLGEFKCFNRLKDVPMDEVGLIIGSSGFGQHRFLEIVKQGGRADLIYA